MAKNIKSENRRTKFYHTFKNEFFMWILLVPTVISLIIGAWDPILKGMFTSLFKTRGFSAVEFVGLKNYANVLSDTMFMATISNTFKYVFWSLLFGGIPPIIIAIIFQEVLHFRKTIRLLTYIPSVAPSLAVSVIWVSIYSSSTGGLLNQLLALFGANPQVWLENPKLTIPLIMISASWTGIPGTVLLYFAGLQTVNQELYEAATIDGAGIMRRLRTVTLPHLYPTILLMWVRQIIGIFQIFQEPLIMTDGGPNNASLSINLTAYKMAFVYGQVDRSLALSTVVFIILMVITVFYFKLDKKINE